MNVELKIGYAHAVELTEQTMGAGVKIGAPGDIKSKHVLLTGGPHDHCGTITIGNRHSPAISVSSNTY